MTVLVLAAVPAALAVVVWAITDLEKFVLFAVLGATVIPASLFKPGGTNVAAVDLLLLVALAAWLINNSLRNAPNPRLRGNPVFVAAAVFVAVNWISIAWSVNTHATITKSIQLTELLVIFLLVFASIPRSVRTIRNGFVLLVALTAILAVATLIAYATHPSSHSQGTYLAGYNKNAIGSFLASGVVCAYALHTYLRGTVKRSLLVLALALEIGGLLASGSRGAMLGAAVGVLVVSALLKRGIVTALGVVAVLGAVYVSIVAPAISQKTVQAGSYDTSTIRLHIWSNAVHKIEQHPLLGTGEGTYYDSQYGQPDPNNLLLLTWAELGVPGMMALAFFLVGFGRLLLKARRLPGEAGVLAATAGAVTTSVLVHSQVDVSWIRGNYSLGLAMVGIMVALTALAEEEWLTAPIRARGSGTATREDTPVLLGSV